MHAFISFSPKGRNEIKACWTNARSHLGEDGATCWPATRCSGFHGFHEFI